MAFLLYKRLWRGCDGCAGLGGDGLEVGGGLPHIKVMTWAQDMLRVRGWSVAAWAVALVLVSGEGWAQSGSFPLLSLGAGDVGAMQTAFATQWLLFSKNAAGTGGAALFYITLAAALIGAILIVVNKKYQDLATFGSWFILLLCLVFAPYNSRLLFYPVAGNSCNVNPVTVGIGGTITAGDVCGFTPQVVALHVGSTVSLLLKTTFTSMNLSDGVQNMVDMMNLRNNPSLSGQSPQASLDALKAFQDDAACGGKNAIPMPKDLYQAPTADGVTPPVAPPAAGEAFVTAKDVRSDFFKHLMMADGGSSATYPPAMKLYRSIPAGWEQAGVVGAYLQGISNILYASGIRTPDGSNGGKYVITQAGTANGSIMPLKEAVDKIFEQFNQGNGGTDYMPSSIAFLFADGDNPSSNGALNGRRALERQYKGANVLKAVFCGRSSTSSNTRSGKNPCDTSAGMTKFDALGIDNMPVGVERFQRIGGTINRNGILTGGQVSAVGNTCADKSDAAFRKIMGNAIWADNACPGFKSVVEAMADPGKRAQLPEIVKNVTGAVGCMNNPKVAEMLKSLTKLIDAPGGRPEGVVQFMMQNHLEAAQKAAATQQQTQAGQTTGGPRSFNPTDMKAGILGSIGGGVFGWFAGMVSDIMMALGLLFAGPLAVMALTIIQSLVKLALMTMIIVTPLVFIAGVLMPAQAMGMLFVVVVGTFVLSMVPATFHIINFLVDVLSATFNTQDMWQSYVNTGAVLWGAAFMYFNIVGLTMFIMFKLGDPGNLSKLSGLDGVAQKLAKTSAAVMAAAVLPLVAAGAGAAGAAMGGKTGAVLGAAGKLAKAKSGVGGLMDAIKNGEAMSTVPVNPKAKEEDVGDGKQISDDMQKSLDGMFGDDEESKRRYLDASPEQQAAISEALAFGSTAKEGDVLGGNGEFGGMTARYTNQRWELRGGAQADGTMAVGGDGRTVLPGGNAGAPGRPLPDGLQVIAGGGGVAQVLGAVQVAGGRLDSIGELTKAGNVDRVESIGTLGAGSVAASREGQTEEERERGVQRTQLEGGRLDQAGRPAEGGEGPTPPVAGPVDTEKKPAVETPKLMADLVAYKQAKIAEFKDHPAAVAAMNNATPEQVKQMQAGDAKMYIDGDKAEILATNEANYRNTNAQIDKASVLMQQDKDPYMKQMHATFNEGIKGITEAIKDGLGGLSVETAAKKLQEQDDPGSVSIGRSMLSGFMGGIKALGGAGAIPYLGPILKEAVNEFYQAPQRVRADRMKYRETHGGAAGNFASEWWNSTSMNADATRQKYFEAELGSINGAVKYRTAGSGAATVSSAFEGARVNANNLVLGHQGKLMAQLTSQLEAGGGVLTANAALLGAKQNFSDVKSALADALKLGIMSGTKEGVTMGAGVAAVAAKKLPDAYGDIWAARKKYHMAVARESQGVNLLSPTETFGALRRLKPGVGEADRAIRQKMIQADAWSQQSLALAARPAAIQQAFARKAQNPTFWNPNLEVGGEEYTDTDGTKKTRYGIKINNAGVLASMAAADATHALMKGQEKAMLNYYSMMTKSAKRIGTAVGDTFLKDANTASYVKRGFDPGDYQIQGMLDSFKGKMGFMGDMRKAEYLLRSMQVAGGDYLGGNFYKKDKAAVEDAVKKMQAGTMSADAAKAAMAGLGTDYFKGIADKFGADMAKNAAELEKALKGVMGHMGGVTAEFGKYESAAKNWAGQVYVAHPETPMKDLKAKKVRGRTSGVGDAENMIKAALEEVLDERE